MLGPPAAACIFTEFFPVRGNLNGSRRGSICLRTRNDPSALIPLTVVKLLPTVTVEKSGVRLHELFTGIAFQH